MRLRHEEVNHYRLHNLKNSQMLQPFLIDKYNEFFFSI